jgi:hypothetical protein
MVKESRKTGEPKVTEKGFWSRIKVSARWAKRFGVVLAVINVIFVLAWLVRVDLLIPELAQQLGVMNAMGDIVPNTSMATILVLFAAFAAIFSIPFLMQMRFKSKLVKFLSGMLTVVPAWIWTGIAIWTFGGLGGAKYVGPAVQYTVYAPFSANWLVLLADILWLIVAVYVIWQLGIEGIYGWSRKKKAAAKQPSRRSEVDVLADAVKSSKKE